MNPRAPTSWTCGLVTGASSGIGKALATKLAAGGTNLVLVARSTERLEELARELRSRHRVEVEVLSADLADAGDLARVEDRLVVGPAIDLLVNNAGLGTWGPLSTLDVDTEARLITVHCTALLRLTHAALVGMLERERGTVLNISSLGSLQPGPLCATYVATKAFVTSFSESLYEEVRGTGVSVTVALPGFTRTEFQARAGADAATVPDFLWQTGDQVAAEALSAAGKGRALVITGFGNRVGGSLIDRLPHRVKRRAAGLVTRRL